MDKSKPFKITMPIMKAYEDEDGNVYIRGLGGDAEPDYDPKVKRIERLSLECINDLKAQILAKKLPLIPRHWERGGSVINDNPEWDDTLGICVDLIINPYGQMFPLIKLDMDNSRSVTLFKQIKKGKKLGLSWGGLPIAWHTEFDDDGMEIRVFDKLELWHFAVTTKPVNGRTLNYPLSVVSKAVDWSKAETVKTDCVTVQVEYPELQEVQAMVKSYQEAEKDCENKPEEKAETDDTKKKKEVKEPMTPEELKAFQDSMAASFKSAIAPVMEKVDALEKKVEVPAAKTEIPDTEKINSMIASSVKSAVKDALEARDGDNKGEPGVKTEAEVQDMITEAVNKAMEKLANGLKSKQDDGGKPGGDDKGEESEVVKALKQIQSGEKTIDDFSRKIQVALEDFSAKAFEIIEEGMSNPGLK